MSDFYDRMEMVFQPELQRLRVRSELYDQLLYAVERKFPGESRHETALRYITQRELFSIGAESGTASTVASNKSTELNPLRDDYDLTERLEQRSGD